MNILEDLQYRELIYQLTDQEALAKRLNKGKVTLYCGFDPSADSLHLGNLLMILVLRRFQLSGHTPIAIAGGGTGLIGDPSGRNEERQLNTQNIVDEWNKKIKKQIERFLDFEGQNAAHVINNYDWLGKIKIVEYLRDIGKHFSINEMLAKESVRVRLEGGISFTEFNYMILQSIDFLELNKNYDCELQIGGSDQWGNIVAGVDLVKKKNNQQVFGLTVPLITKSDGTKFGKTAGGAVWLDANKTSPYQFYQFFMNSADEDVIRFIKAFTFLTPQKIENLEKEIKVNPEKRQAQKVLAGEVTELVHGTKARQRAEDISAKLFNGDIKSLSVDEIQDGFGDVPSYKSVRQDYNIVDLLVDSGVSSSKRQAREDIMSGAIHINGERCQNLEKKLDKYNAIGEKYTVVRRGKNKYFLINW